MSATAAPKTTKQYHDLQDQISMATSYCLNENKTFTFSNLFIGDETLMLKSDVDEQLILHIEFMDAVKLHSISLVAPHDESAPSLFKLFVNRNNLGFSDIGDIEPVQTLELSHKDLTGDSIPLKFVKFQRVSSLTLFIEENMGSDETCLSSFKCFGESIAGTNMNDIKKSG